MNAPGKDVLRTNNGNQNINANIDDLAIEESSSTQPDEHKVLSQQQLRENLKEPDKGPQVVDLKILTGEETKEQKQSTLPVKPVKEKFAVNVESLIIREWEIKFANKLFQFVPSARATKRFSNVYRLLKASVDKKDLSEFEGNAEQPGSFQVPMLLLAMVVGSSTQAVKLFPDLRAKLSDDKSLVKCLEEISAATPDEEKYLNFIGAIRAVVSQRGFPNDVQIVRAWMPRVSRFSFDLSRTLK